MHATTFLGLALIALSWGGVEFYLGNQRTRAEVASIQNTTNLAHLFEDHVVRLIKSNDRILRQLQLASVNDTLNFEFNRLMAEIAASEEPDTQVALVDAKGAVTGSSHGPLAAPVNLADREHFRVHAESAEAGLVISKPVLSRLSGEWRILFSRGLRTPHGAFAGVVFTSIRAERLARFFELVELGPGGAVTLIGRDGIVRASAGLRVVNIGTSMRNSLLLKQAAKAREGSFFSSGNVDGVRRIISYRVLDDYGLVLGVGAPEVQIFAEYWRWLDTSRIAVTGLTLLILAVIIASARHRRRLERAREELHASEALAREKSHELQLTLDHMSQGIMMIDKDETVALMNRRAVALLGLSDEFVASRPKFDDLVAYQWRSGEFGQDGAAVDPQLRHHIKGGLRVPLLQNYERVRPDGTVLEIRSIGLPDGGFVRTFTDISERKRNEEKIAHMAHHDPLTGLANRVLLRGEMESALRRARRHGDGFALLLIDLDRFKAVNDTLGHAAGDALLNEVAERLRGCVRDCDTIARLGGDEFAILQDGVAGRESVEILARRLLEQVSAHYFIGGHRVVIGTSIGIARSVDCPGIEELFQNADLALYRVKSEGRNGYRLFEPEMDAQAQARRELEAELRAARDNGEFEIHYQPIFDLATRQVASVEALLRWNHPLRGRMSPADFIPLAEEIGLMAEIDTWVLENATATAACWASDVRIAINLSPAKFKRRNLVEAVQGALANSGLMPQRLELEISERIPLREDDGSVAALRALRALGVRIALDDFGTGSTSLADLRAFRFDSIKIDQSFVAEMEGRPESAAIVAAIAGLGHSLGAETTAEGVETQRHAELVRAAGCTQAQGYLYSRPLSADGIAALLRGSEQGRAVA